MKSSSTVACAVLLATILACPVIAGKVTVDPNKATPVTTAPPQAKPDPRLAQKVTYTASGKRLHSVLEDISKQTGVTVYSGKTPADWQVRDLPVIVCVKDLALDKVLGSIADATHLALTSTTEEGVIRYRIWRDSKREKQLADYFKKRSEKDLARVKWEWNGLAKFAQAHNSDKPQDLSTACARDMGRIIAALPSGALDSVLSGKHVHLTPQNTQPPLFDYLKAVCLDWWQIERAPYLSRNDPALAYRYNRNLNDYELASMSLDIALSTRGAANLDCELHSPLGFRRSTYLRSMYREVLLKQDSAKSSDPKDPAPPQIDCAPTFVKIDLDKPDTAIAEKKVKIPKPGVDPEALTVGDVIIGISQAFDLNVVCEDFASHRMKGQLGGLAIYDRDIDLASTLRALYGYYDGQLTFDWCADSGSGILVGSAPKWWDRHRALAPEPLVSNIVNKYNGDGLQFDDMLPIVLLTEDQRWEWIFFNRDLFMWEPVPHTEPFWRLYASLSPEDKALAASPAGLPLARLSPALVQAAFAEAAELAEAEGLEKRGEGMSDDDPDLQKRMEEWQKQHYPELGRAMLGVDPLPVDFVRMVNDILADFPEIKAMWDVPTDIKAISKLRMRLIAKEYPTETALDEKDKLVEKPVPEDQRHRSYILAIQGDGVNLRIKAPLYFYPMYSPKRRAQLEEARKKNTNADSMQPK